MVAAASPTSRARKAVFSLAGVGGERVHFLAIIGGVEGRGREKPSAGCASSAISVSSLSLALDNCCKHVAHKDRGSGAFQNLKMGMSHCNGKAGIAGVKVGGGGS